MIYEIEWNKLIKQTTRELWTRIEWMVFLICSILDVDMFVRVSLCVCGGPEAVSEGAVSIVI